MTKLGDVSIESMTCIIQPQQTTMIEAGTVSLDISNVLEVQGYGNSDGYTNMVVLKEFV